MYIAPNRTEYPIAHQLVGQRKWYDQHAQKEVSDGEAGDKPVLNILQRFFGSDGDDHQQVANHHKYHEHDGEYGGDNNAGQRIATGVESFVNKKRFVDIK